MSGDSHQGSVRTADRQAAHTYIDRYIETHIHTQSQTHTQADTRIHTRTHRHTLGRATDVTCHLKKKTVLTVNLANGRNETKQVIKQVFINPRRDSRFMSADLDSKLIK